MQNIATIDPAVPGPGADILAKVKKKLGSVPNIFATMANSPAALEAYLAFAGALDKGVLDAALREQIALTVAGANRCDYCASAHTFIGKNLGIDAEEARRNLAGRSSNPRTAVILRFVAGAVESRAEFSDNAKALDELRSAGVTEAEIVEIIAVVALNVFTNYFNHLAGTDIDFPVVDSKSGPMAA